VVAFCSALRQDVDLVEDLELHLGVPHGCLHSSGFVALDQGSPSEPRRACVTSRWGLAPRRRTLGSIGVRPASSCAFADAGATPSGLGDYRTELDDASKHIDLSVGAAIDNGSDNDANRWFSSAGRSLFAGGAPYTSHEACQYQHAAES